MAGNIAGSFNAGVSAARNRVADIMLQSGRNWADAIKSVGNSVAQGIEAKRKKEEKKDLVINSADGQRNITEYNKRNSALYDDGVNIEFNNLSDNKQYAIALGSMIAKTPPKGTDILSYGGEEVYNKKKGGWQLTDEDIDERINSFAVAKSNEAEAVQLTENYVNNPPSQDYAENREKTYVAQSISDNGFKYGSYNPKTDSYNLIVTIPEYQDKDGDGVPDKDAEGEDITIGTKEVTVDSNKVGEYFDSKDVKKTVSQSYLNGTDEFNKTDFGKNKLSKNLESLRPYFTEQFKDAEARNSYVKSLTRDSELSQEQIDSLDLDGDGTYSAGELAQAAINRTAEAYVQDITVNNMLEQSKKTTAQRNINKGTQPKYVETDQQKRDRLAKVAKQKEIAGRNASLSELKTIDGEIIGAASKDDLKYFNSAFPGRDVKWIQDEEGSVAGVRVSKVNDFGKIVKGSEEDYSFSNTDDRKAISRNVIGARGQAIQDKLGGLEDEYYTSVDKLNETVSSIDDTKGGKLGKSESIIKKDFNVKNIYQLPQEVQIALVNRQQQRGGFKSKSELVSYLDINLPNDFDYSTAFRDLSPDLKRVLGPYSGMWFELKSESKNSTASVNFDSNNPLDQEIQSLLNA